jgi:hypothetical protein
MPEDDPKPTDKPAESKTFTQAELDKIVGDRVARERGKFADYDDAKAKAAKFDELDEKSKSEVEKAAERATAAERRAAEADARALRLEVAASKGLNAAQAKRLVGATQEELEADADEILESFKPADGTPAPMPGKPTADLKGGGDPTADEPVDVRAVVESIPRGF